MSRDDLYKEMVKRLSGSKNLVEFVNFYTKHKDSDSFDSEFEKIYGEFYRNGGAIKGTQAPSGIKEETVQAKKETETIEKIISQPDTAIQEIEHTQDPVFDPEILVISKNVAKIAFWAKFWSIITIIGMIIYLLDAILSID